MVSHSVPLPQVPRWVGTSGGSSVLLRNKAKGRQEKTQERKDVFHESKGPGNGVILWGPLYPFMVGIA